jgi:hypothetical protein
MRRGREGGREGGTEIDDLKADPGPGFLGEERLEGGLERGGREGGKEGGREGGREERER